MLLKAVRKFFKELYSLERLQGIGSGQTSLKGGELGDDFMEEAKEAIEFSVF